MLDGIKGKLSKGVSSFYGKVNQASSRLKGILREEEESIVPQTEEELEKKSQVLKKRLKTEIFERENNNLSSLEDFAVITDELNECEIGSAFKIAKKNKVNFSQFTNLLNIYLEYTYIEAMMHLEESENLMELALQELEDAKNRAENDGEETAQQEVEDVQDKLVEGSDQVQDAIYKFNTVIKVREGYTVGTHGEKFEERLEEEWSEKSKNKKEEAKEIKVALEEVKEDLESK